MPFMLLLPCVFSKKVLLYKNTPFFVILGPNLVTLGVKSKGLKSQKIVILNFLRIFNVFC